MNLRAMIEGADEGETVRIPAGTYPGGLVFADLPPNLAIEGVGRVILERGLFGMKFTRPKGLRTRNIFVTDADRHGWFVVDGSGFSSLDCGAEGCGSNGFLSSGTHGVSLSRFVGSDCDGWAVYFSEGGDNLLAENCTLSGCSRGGFQANAHADEGGKPGLTRGLIYRKNTHKGNQKEGGADIQLAGVRPFTPEHGGKPSLIEGNTLSGMLGRAGISIWHDDDPACKSRGVDVRGNTFDFADYKKPKTCIDVHKSCRDIRIWAFTAPGKARAVKGPATAYRMVVG